jgi:hypothetical protein
LEVKRNNSERRSNDAIDPKRASGSIEFGKADVRYDRDGLTKPRRKARWGWVN